MCPKQHWLLDLDLKKTQNILFTAQFKKAFLRFSLNKYKKEKKSREKLVSLYY